MNEYIERTDVKIINKWNIDKATIEELGNMAYTPTFHEAKSGLWLLFRTHSNLIKWRNEIKTYKLSDFKQAEIIVRDKNNVRMSLEEWRKKNDT